MEDPGRLTDASVVLGAGVDSRLDNRSEDGGLLKCAQNASFDR
jgi:hypothetical protein